MATKEHTYREPYPSHCHRCNWRVIIIEQEQGKPKAINHLTYKRSDGFYSKHHQLHRCPK